MFRMTIGFMLAIFLAGQVSASDIRRVVTGPDAKDSKSAAIMDGRIAIAPLANDLGSANLWVTSGLPIIPSKGDTRDKSVGVSPPENGTQFGVVEFAPFNADRPTPPIWHRTRTVDYVVVLAGEIDLMLEDSMVHLKAGDTVVQQATNHAWVNHGKETCRLGFVLMDAKMP
ncbi:cupin domain-containing protein [Bradyrhizobium sp. 197]|uniref:cupin domain-containing protein n=1 Tax=Bradyrhizobium sp. 197 TaxID=2782663 RepID=UPI001FF78D01|nr:cupin domain-containing protein [Bradyrhizobium sp. 197]MCK1474968.1 cupin domain-containing protein [Bradyrhizobium sp. 197]